MQEEWRPVDSYSGYFISNLGRVKSLKNGNETILSSWVNEDGYLCVNLWKDGKRKYFRVHRLVATAFIDNQHNLPEVNHKDGNKANNFVENLEWVTRSQNVQHAFDTGLSIPFCGERNGRHKLTQNDVDEIRKIYIKGSRIFGGGALAKKYGVTKKVIYDIINNTKWKTNTKNL